MPRVAFVLPNLMLGGAEHQAVKLLAALRPGSTSVSLFLLQGWLPDPLRPAVPAAIPVTVAPFGRRDPRVISWLASRFKRDRIEVVQSFLWYADVIAAAASRLAPGVRLVGSERGDRGATFYGPLRRVLDHVIVFPAARRFVANSRASIDALQRAGYPGDRIVLIPNGVRAGDLESARLPAAEFPSGAFVACTVGSLQPYKGVETLVRAVAACDAELSIHALIVGDGPERGALENLAGELGATDRLRFVGRQWPPERWMRMANVGILASIRDEASSNSILEFMALGRAVFASAVGGSPELVQDGVTGRLFRPGDWRSLARMLEAAARDRQDTLDMGARAASRARSRFSIDAAAESYVQLWREEAASRLNGPE